MTIDIWIGDNNLFVALRWRWLKPSFRRGAGFASFDFGPVNGCFIWTERA